MEQRRIGNIIVTRDFSLRGLLCIHVIDQSLTRLSHSNTAISLVKLLFTIVLSDTGPLEGHQADFSKH